MKPVTSSCCGAGTNGRGPTGGDRSNIVAGHSRWCPRQRSLSLKCPTREASFVSPVCASMACCTSLLRTFAIRTAPAAKSRAALLFDCRKR